MLAALVQHLATGSRKADGSANASGRVWFFEPGTTTEAVVYEDADAQVQVTQPVTLDAAGKAEIYVTNPVRLKTEYVVSTGVYATLDDFEVLSASAPSVGVRNEGWTGVDVDTGSIVAGGDTNLDDVLTSLFTSTGGVDGKYKESAGATARTLKSVIAGIQVSVKDFGAVGNGIADDTTALQAAINRVGALGGGVVYFDPGTYLISSPITMSSLSSVSLVGSGVGASEIVNTNATGNALTLTSCSSFAIYGLQFSHATSSTGAAVSATGCTNILFESIATGGHLYGLDFGGSAFGTEVRGCSISTATDAAARGIRYNTTGTSRGHLITGGSVVGLTGYSFEFNGTVSYVTVVGVLLSANATPVLFNAALTGVGFTFVGSPSFALAGTTKFDLSGLATDPGLKQFGNTVDGYVVSQASGGGGGSSHTPDLSRGSEIHVRLTSGGAAVCTIGAPIPTPSGRDVTLLLRLTAAAGGNITWTFNAVFVLVGGGATIAGTDGQTTLAAFNWDPQTSEWREQWRSATAT